MSALSANAHVISDPFFCNHVQGDRQGRQPQRFNLESYLEEKRKADQCDILSDQEVEAKKAKALAAYHHYKEERQAMGDIEDDTA